MTIGSHVTWPRDPADAALVLDFDGTLAPIVDDPETSAMPDGTRAALTPLVGLLGAVAVISGRPASFLQERVALEGVRLLGLYGLEEATEEGIEIRDDVAGWQPAVVRARGALKALAAAVHGVRVEDKGHAVAVHWRNADDREAAQRAVRDAVTAVAADTGLAPVPGKMVLELRPPVAADKGTAVARIADAFTDVAYAGDDLGDLPAFAEVHRRDGLAIAVDHGTETPQEVRDAADLVVDGVEGMTAWLARLHARLA